MPPDQIQTQAEYADSGVDLTLIRWMLDMTPASAWRSCNPSSMRYGRPEDGMSRPDFTAALRVLVECGVDFVVVGGIAAVLQSVPVNTFDLDVVHSTEPANIARLLTALDRLDAYYRLQPERRLRPDETHLSSPGHQLLMTRFGPLDVLGSIGKGRRYTDLLPHVTEMDVGEGIRVRVLDLETLIATKEEAGQEKDLAALPWLRSVLEESRRRK